MRRIALLALLAACSEAPAPAVPERAAPLVYTTFYPTTYLARRIGGGLVEVVCPVPGDADPISWKPDEDAIRAYQEADLIVLNGAGFEKWAETVSLPAARTVETARPFRENWIEYVGTATHRHGGEGAHSHEGLDGHTWLDPVNAKAQAREILLALRKRLPGRVAGLQANFDALAADLDALHDALGALRPPPLLASHPAYNYLAARYGWKIENLDLDPEDVPSAAQVDAVARMGPRILLWEAAPLPEAAERFREAGIASVEFSPLEQPPESGDFLAAMQANIERLRAAVGG